MWKMQTGAVGYARPRLRNRRRIFPISLQELGTALRLSTKYQGCDGAREELLVRKLL